MSFSHRKKFSSVFARTVSDNDFLRLNRIYSLQLLSAEKKLSRSENRVIDAVILNYDCSERTIKVYHRRWLLLAVIVLSLMISSMQFLQFCIISNVIQVHFEVDSRLIDLTSILYMLIHFIAYVPITFYYCDKQVSGNGIVGVWNFHNSILAVFVQRGFVRRSRFSIDFMAQILCSCVT